MTCCDYPNERQSSFFYVVFHTPAALVWIQQGMWNLLLFIDVWPDPTSSDYQSENSIGITFKVINQGNVFLRK